MGFGAFFASWHPPCTSSVPQLYADRKEASHARTAPASGGGSSHPLLAADETMLGRFDELRGKDVQLQGKLYHATGLILVSSIVPD